jgi:hypothetical protein
MELNRSRLAKIHPKFEKERQCQNERCGGYFLLQTEEEQKYCPLCRRRGYNDKEIIEKDVVHRDVNTVELQKQVKELQEKLATLEKTALKKADRSHKNKTFTTKDCNMCDGKFTPTAPNQQMCTKCRDELTGN